jgi:mRNA interferase RelE/StbE
MMAYKVEWKPRVIEDLESLEPQIQERIIEKVELIKDSPNRFLDYLKKYAVHRMRVGDYRVFIDLHTKDRLLEVLTIRHRKNAYKRL